MTYFLAPDADNEPTIWRGYYQRPSEQILRRCELPPVAWPLWERIVEAVTE